MLSYPCPPTLCITNRPHTLDCQASRTSALSPARVPPRKDKAESSCTQKMPVLEVEWLQASGGGTGCRCSLVRFSLVLAVIALMETPFTLSSMAACSSFSGSTMDALPVCLALALVTARAWRPIRLHRFLDRSEKCRPDNGQRRRWTVQAAFRPDSHSRGSAPHVSGQRYADRRAVAGLYDSCTSRTSPKAAAISLLASKPVQGVDGSAQSFMIH
jgi:hypothetical protein